MDFVLKEMARRLLGRLPDEQEQRSKPATVQQHEVWAATARFLDARLQLSTAEMKRVPGHRQRAPDMSPAAGAAFRAVLREVASDEVSRALPPTAAVIPPTTAVDTPPAVRTPLLAATTADTARLQTVEAALSSQSFAEAALSNQPRPASPASARHPPPEEDAAAHGVVGRVAARLPGRDVTIV